MLTTLKDILAAVGLTVLAFGLGWAIGEQRARSADAAAYAPVKAAADSLGKVAAASEKQDAAHHTALDSALATLARLTVKRDTVQVSVAVPLPIADSAALVATRDSLEQLRAASQQVANACTVVERDCAAVRAERDSLLRLIGPKAPMPTRSDTSARLTASAALLFDAFSHVPAGRLGASFRLTPAWSVTAEGDVRFARADSARIYVGAVRTWSIW